MRRGTASRHTRGLWVARGSFDYTIGTGPIRWPFTYTVPISSAFGSRAAPCRGCSTDHSGIDSAYGYGMAIFSVADGVVV